VERASFPQPLLTAAFRPPGREPHSANAGCSQDWLPHKAGFCILGTMTIGHGYKARYDYVELTVERQEDHWSLSLRDRRHGEEAVDEERYETPDEAKEAALALAQRHINLEHNDTLLTQTVITWHEY
jgi:hypothetical protein